MRIPASEPHFRLLQPTEPLTLSDVFSDHHVDTTLSHFAESIALATLYGLCVTHRRLATSGTSAEEQSQQFWTRHEWLVKTINRHVELLQKQSDLLMTNSWDTNPGPIYNHMMAQTIIVHIEETIRLHPRAFTTSQHASATAWSARAERAISDMMQLIRGLSCLDCFVVCSLPQQGLPS